MSNASSRLTAEMVHVLFMDLVGYSLLSIEEQTRLRRELLAIVQAAPEVVRGTQRGELIRRDLGDGMALVFARDPIAPAQCAVEIAHALRECPHLRLRMGIHSGPVVREGTGDNENVAGGGINTAQRVMDCGDTGHILLSHSSAEALIQFAAWTETLHDLGTCEVKHGVRLHLFNLVSPEAGNPARPTRLKIPSTVAPYVATSPQAAIRTSPEKVVLLYRRNAQPEDQVLVLLEKRLTAEGYEVFIDRHIAVGVAWAAEIERQVRGADAVIPLLSETSVASEMLEDEIQTAHDAAQRQDGRPRLLPVRVCFSGPLPPSIAGILAPLQHTQWNSPADDASLVDEILRALRSASAPEVAVVPLEPVGGAVPLDSHFYIERPTDAEFHRAMVRQDSIVLVKGARQIGKTSLLARGLQRAREGGARVVLTDFQKLSAAHLENADALFLALANLIADQLDLDVSPRQVWSADRAPSLNFERFLRREVLNKLPDTIVWGLDEVDRLFTCPFGSDVFALFRSWHNERSLDPTGPWRRLTLAITYATEAYLFITDLNQSPFNVGTRLMLSDFTLTQVAELNARYGSPLRTASEVDRYYDLVSGHPYLVRRGLHEMTTHKLDVDAFMAQAERDEGLFGDHLRRILVLLARDPDLCEVVRKVLRGQECPSDESFYRLCSAGVMAGETRVHIHPRCRLYGLYLTRHLTA
jgi:class 3 adenylate cyclase